MVKPLPAERPPGPPSAVGELRFDGKLLTSGAPPGFWFRNERTYRHAEEALVEAAAGHFTVYGLAPGNYGVQVTVNDNPKNGAMYPGDLYSWTVFDVPAKRALTIPLKRVIHLQLPQDNASELEGWEEKGDCEPRALVESGPVEFRWKSLGPGAEYSYRIATIACPYKQLKENYAGTTTGTRLTLNIAPSAPAEFYILTLEARRSGTPIGILITHAPRFVAWDYRFRVK